jgi:cob(I)alamin adenosyltransferase
LFAGPRVWKDDPRIEAYGTVDELSAAIGLARTANLPAGIDATLQTIQHELFSVGAQLATPSPSSRTSDWVAPAQVQRLENEIDHFEASLPALREFILPCGTPAAAHLHVARATCRRAERRTVSLAQRESSAQLDEVLRYLNRLGDLLFVLSRAANAAAGQADVPWIKPTAERT